VSAVAADQMDAHDRADEPAIHADPLCCDRFDAPIEAHAQPFRRKEIGGTGHARTLP